jgi:hypothetical protein
MHAECLVHHILLYFIVKIISGEQQLWYATIYYSPDLISRSPVLLSFCIFYSAPPWKQIEKKKKIVNVAHK